MTHFLKAKSGRKNKVTQSTHTDMYTTHTHTSSHIFTLHQLATTT